jgi:hypothetical protein
VHLGQCQPGRRDPLGLGLAVRGRDSRADDVEGAVLVAPARTSERVTCEVSRLTGLASVARTRSARRPPRPTAEIEQGDRPCPRRQVANVAIRASSQYAMPSRQKRSPSRMRY